jgi:hypothetical protein
MISVIVSIMNRVHLLRYSMDAVIGNQRMADCEDKLEINICDSGSTDGLDQYLEELSSVAHVVSVNKYFLDETKSPYHKEFNCPALIYNTLVKVSSGDCIVKIDPEFTFITTGFIKKALDIIRVQNRPAIVMPLPHHVYDFEFASVQDIVDNYKGHEYQTHINKETAELRNVYYGCMFSREAYINLGGIDVRFMRAIGSEDDHMTDQWRRKYGTENVITLLEEEGVHLWHGEWGKGVPQELYNWVNLNAQLRKLLSNDYPNNGDFSSIQWPELQLTSWAAGKKIESEKVIRP